MSSVREGPSDELLAGWSTELEAVLYSPEVEEAINEVFPSSNPLDKRDFNPVEYINELFPSEQSLAGIDDRVTTIRVQINQLDEEIRTIVRGQADAGHDGRQSLEEAHEAIQELFGRIRNIKEKAEQSEHTVKKITSDIKQLDNAKKHLTDSIRTLERLRFLITNMDQLQVDARGRRYGDVTTQLHGVMGVVEEFRKYQSIPQIKQLIDRLQSLQYDLGQQIKVDFEKAFSIKGAPQGTKAHLHDACLVVDALGGKSKDELIGWFVRLQLSDYEVMYHDSLEGAWLDKVDRRYSWMKRTLLNYEEENKIIFPETWAIPERTIVQFCEATRSSLTGLMRSKAGDLEVKLLLYAIQKTTAFEKLISQKYANSQYILSLAPPTPEPVKDDKEDKEDEEEKPHKKRPDSSPFMGMISRCFEPHLSIYISSQDKSLFELMDNLVADIKSKGQPLPSSDGSGVVMSSAADLFVFYKKCLVQCTSLSTGPALLELTELFKKYLREYCSRVLTPCLPKLSTTTSGKLSLGSLRGAGPADTPPLSKADLLTSCSVLCTADYCLETTQQLEGKLKEKIKLTLADKITFTTETEGFHSIISSTIQLLVQDLENLCTSAFNAMVKIPWGSVESVGDSSPYVTTVGSHIRNTVPVLRETLSSARKYFINFCHKFANVFIPAFITHLYKCKPISTVAAEQLLLDCHSLKTYLLELPSVGTAVARKAPPSYTKLVQKGLERAELIIKVVMSPHEQAEEFISSYRKLMQGDTEVNNFHKVLEMKGLKRSEQSAMMELFRTKLLADGGADSAHTGGSDKRIQPIKRLEKLMRF
ncbi:vacuolar protein sorting-associated protein 53 homolog [Halichondria panicea]|uniref:vacuolar protein sorting-associated protein 53 homolog n=1 Tax=Halichondria panicea TaxID=6063 RepID=UPI00312B79C1